MCVRRCGAWGRAVTGVVVGSLVWVMGAGAAQAQDGVIDLEDTVIKGRIQKPEAFYILQHAQLDYESLDAKPSFITELVETVEEDPF